MKQKYFIALTLLSAMLVCQFIGYSQTERIYPLKTQLNSNDQNQKKPYCKCDTLPLPSNWLTLHEFFCEGNIGSPTGKNAYNNQVIAGYFDLSATNYKYILGADFMFATVNSSKKANLNKPVYFKLYMDDNGKPGQQFGPTIEKKLCELQHNSLLSMPTRFDELPDIVLPGTKKLYIGMDVSNLIWDTASSLQKNHVTGVRDSVILLSSKLGLVNPSTAWTQFKNGNWRNFSEVYHMDIGLAIRPIVSTSANGCGEYFNQNKYAKLPVLKKATVQNPFINSINMQLDLQKASTVSIKLFNLGGLLVAEKEGYFKEGINVIQLNDIKDSKGKIYVLKISIGTEEKTIKLLKQ